MNVNGTFSIESWLDVSSDLAVLISILIGVSAILAWWSLGVRSER